MRKASMVPFAIFFCLILGHAHADPPVLPPTPPPEVPCRPLICLQLTDAVELAPNTWRFEFRVLNWTAFTDRPCSPTDPGCIDRTSPGAAAEGLVLVRSAGLSTVPFRVLPVDPNGAPLGVSPVSESGLGVVRRAGGELGVELGMGFVSRIVRLVDPVSGDSLPSSCYELRDPFTGLVILSEDAVCGPVTSLLNEVDADYEVFDGDDATPNTWTSSLCTQDQIIWTQDPAASPPLVVPPGDSNVQPSCPVTCEEKTSLDNNLDGFVVEIEDFLPGDRIVFNWYLLGSSGPIASGAPPTPTDPGTLGPSPSDPWGFSFGSYQIDRKPSCAAGDCDTVLVTTPPVTDPALNCLVDDSLERNDLPFDIYVSLGPAGTDPPCDVRPVVPQDAKGLERLQVLATSGSETDQITVQFRNLDTNVIDKSVRLPLHNASAEISTEDLVGRYEVGGTCENTSTNQFFFLKKFEMAIPRRGDLADVTSTALALEVDEVAGGVAMTSTIPPGELDLDDVVEACHFVQLRDSSGDVHILGTVGGPDVLTRHGANLVIDTEAPGVTCEPDFLVGTDADGGGDCSVQVGTTAVATDAAGGFELTNDLNVGDTSRSFGATVGAQEIAVQTATGVFTASLTGSSSNPVTFSVVDDAGAAGTCTTTVFVEDDTPPLVECRLLPDEPPPGPGNGGGGGGPPGGSPPGLSDNDHFFIVDFSASDNCTADADLTVTADIDGVTVVDGDQVQITTRNNPPVESQISNGRLQILTHLGGVLSVTATDLNGRVSTCETVPLVP